MWRLFIGFALTCLALSSAAADDAVLGTHWVKYQPVQVGGDLQGCSLVFLALQEDRAYLDGNHVAVNGSINLRNAPDNALLLGLKVGLKNMTQGTAYERPVFAYIQTASNSSAKAKQQSADGEDGYRMFVYNAKEPAILNLIVEILKNSKVTIGYNRKSGGIDVLVPLDLTVVDSDYSPDLRVMRKRSPESLRDFTICARSIIKSAMDD